MENAQQYLFLWVLDHTDGTVHRYKWYDKDIEDGNAEEFLIECGHSTSNCEWMVTESSMAKKYHSHEKKTI